MEAPLKAKELVQYFQANFLTNNSPRTIKPDKQHEL